MSDWLPKISIGSLPDIASKNYKDKEAILFNDKSITFKELKKQINNTAKGLLKLGVNPLDKVAIWVPNSLEFIYLFFAIIKVGGIAVPINTLLRTKDTSYLLKQSNAKFLITIEKSGPINYLYMINEMFNISQKSYRTNICQKDYPDLEKIAVLGDDKHNGTFSLAEVIDQGSSLTDNILKERENNVSPDDTAFILYTSGSTGLPKGVMHSHIIIRDLYDHSNRMAITFKDVILMFLPLYHIFGLGAGVLIPMVTGAKMVLTDWFDPQKCIDLIEKEKVTILHGFDLHYKNLIDAQEEAPREISSLRTGMIAAGSKGSIKTAKLANKKLCHGLLSAYSLTETGLAACLSFLTSTIEQRTEASGFPIPGVELKIIDPDSGKEIGPGKPGEILIRGYLVMQGYYNKPEETSKIVDEKKWLHTGDLGLIRPDGHLRFLGRLKDMLKIGGENVDPIEVESYLIENPDVEQVAVVGYQDQESNEVGVAFIKKIEGKRLNEREIISYLKGKIASYKIPKYIMFKKDLPMTSTGKIKKNILREIAARKIKNT